MTELFSVFTLFYLTVIFTLYLGVLRSKKKSEQKLSSPFHFQKVTVAIPARNEENHIINCLTSLLRPNNLKYIERILVLNDDSTDRTRSLVLNIMEKFPVVECIDVIRNPNENTSPKKRLITQAISLTTTEWLVLTDADCIVQDNWIETMMTHADQQTSMICGPVEFFELGNWFIIWQKIEFAGMMQVSSGGIGIGKPTTCNAANMWIKKEDFLAVDGFSGVASIISGDDEFLMHKFQKRNPNSIHYVYTKNAVVKTYSFPTFSGFLNQRIRWASKGLLYQSIPYRIFLIMIWLYHFLIVMGLLYAVYSPEFLPVYLLGFSAKIAIDSLILMKSNHFLTKKIKLYQVILAQWIQNPYIVLAGLLGTFGSFTWKGVKYK